MSRFDLNDYEPVASRVQRFYEEFPNGAIHCEIVHDDGTRVVVKATVWRSLEDPRPAAVDYAEELLTDRGVNSTSRIENACTSATGRAVSIAAHGLGPSDWTKKPSREEMAKVQRREAGPRSDARVDRPVGLISEKQVNYARALYKNHGRPMPAQVGGLDKDTATRLIDALKGDTFTEAEEREILFAGQNDMLMGDEEPF